MEKKVYILGGVLLAIVLIVAVLTLYSPSSVPSEVLLTETDNGNEIAVKKGQSMVISLDSNPTTGYTWELVEHPDEHILQQVGELEFAQESELIGAGGVETIRFNVVGPGLTAIKLEYHRPWETNVSPEKIFYIHVVAR